MRYLDITSPDINNGLGCRITVWIAGCTHHCKECQNQHTWNFNQGSPLIIENTIAKDAWDKISKALDKPYIQGLTFSGGDPFAGQSEHSLKELNLFIHYFITIFPEKDIWLYTGDTWEKDIITNPLKFEIAKACNVIVDGEFKIEQKDTSLAFRGSKNQRLIDVQKTLKNHNKVILLNIKD